MSQLATLHFTARELEVLARLCDRDLADRYHWASGSTGTPPPPTGSFTELNSLRTALVEAKISVERDALVDSLPVNTGPELCLREPHDVCAYASDRECRMRCKLRHPAL